MSWLSLDIEGARSWYEPGATLSGKASWSLDADADAVELRLFWFTEGRGTQDVGIVAEKRIEAPGSSGSREFRFRLPEGPYSFSGKLITLKWALELIAEPSGLTERADLVVGPQPIEVRLGESFT